MGMDKSELVRVEHHPGGFAGAVLDIADDRMAGLGKVDANLVFAS
jgi:hypothetical protein